MNNHDARALVALGISSTAYAALLETETGRAWVEENTWLSVVLGVVLVLGLLRPSLPRRAWDTIAAGFVIAGTPLILRSLLWHQRSTEQR